MPKNQVLAGAFGVLHIAMIIIFATCTEYVRTPTTTVNYSMFQDVHVMIFIGFGFLMAFLHKDAMTTTGHSFIVASFVALWYILNAGFWQKVIGHASDQGGIHWERIRISIASLVTADFCGGAILISFGAMVGRISWFQLLILALWEVIVYAINEAILVEKYHVADIGGSMIIHTFGAYFGLACSFIWDKFQSETQLSRSDKHNKSTPTSDTFAMIGTLFLWCFWPSFNAALSGDNGERAVINTYLSIVSSCVVAFYVTCLIYGGKFRMVEVQNSTLAGGVAIGATADMLVNPYGAILIGSAAGAISVLGYRFLSPFLEKAVGLRDTCGIHNLHGMPGLIGGVISCIVVATIQEKDYNGRGIPLGSIFAHRGAAALPNGNFANQKQALAQLYSLLTTLGLAIVGGGLAGFVLGLLKDWNLESIYTDSQEWVGAPTSPATVSGSPMLPGGPQQLSPSAPPASATFGVTTDESEAGMTHQDTWKPSGEGTNEPVVASPA